MKKLFLILIVFLLLAGFASAALDDAGMYLSFDDDDLTGSDPDDISGNGYSITNDGATTGATGILLEAFDFDGASDHLDGTLPGFASQSISWWADVDTWTNGDFFFNRNNANGYFCQITGSGSMACYYETSTASGWKGGSVSGITTTGWNHFVLTGTDGDVDLWVNGVQNHLTSSSFTRTATDDVGVIGAHNSGSSGFFDGTMDEMAMYDRVLSSSEISELYNSGSGYNPYSTPAATDNLTISISDAWDSSALTNVSATLLGQTFTNTTGNVIYTNISQNASVITDINLTAQDYFDGTQTSVNLSSNQAFTLFQSQISFNATELYTNNSISNVTFTVSANTDNPKYMSEGSYTVVASHPDYFDKSKDFNVSALDNFTLIVDGMSDTILNITAVEGFGGSSVDNFTVVANNSLFSVSGTTNTTYLELSVLSGYNYTLNWSRSGYISEFETIPVTSSIENYTFTVFRSVSVNFNFFDEETLLSLDNVSFDILGTSFSNSFDTGSGNDLLIEDLPEGIYEIRYSRDNYTDRSYHVIIPHLTSSYANLSLYLIDEDISQLFLRKITDQGNNPLTTYYLEVQRPYPSTDNTSLIYRAVEIASIDNQGDAVFSAIPNTQQYRFRILDENLQLVNTLTPSFLVDSNSEIIGTESTESMEAFNSASSVVSSLTYSNSTTSFIWDYTAPVSIFQACLEVQNVSGVVSSTVETCSTSNTGTISTVIDPSLNTTYYAVAFIYTDANTRFQVDDSEKDFSFGASRNNVAFIGSILYFLLMLLAIGVSFGVSVVPGIMIGVIGTIAFSLSLLGLFTLAAYLGGGLLVLGIIILLLIREGRS